MSSSTASSPSLSKFIPESPNRDDFDSAPAAARFNPLFIHSSGVAAHTHGLHAHKCNSTNLVARTPQATKHCRAIDGSNFVLAETQDGARQGKLAALSSFNPNMHENATAAPPSRRVQVVYYLSRSGQLEHPHLLEVPVPPNQGLYLRDVKRKLAVIRGNRLPSTFAWSYKRSYKNGYVWQDLCDDDLIFPAHGCEYVLKGSEILKDQRIVPAEEESAQPARSGIQTDGTKEDRSLACRGPKVMYYDESACAVIGHTSMHVSMSENGTDVATQTEEDPLTSAEGESNEIDEDSKRLPSKHEGLISIKHSSLFPLRGSCTSSRPQKATELNKAEIASPPSSSSATDSPLPYIEVASATSSSNSVGDSSADRLKPPADSIKPGCKTPGRSWMIKAIQELEEQVDAPCIHTAANVDDSCATGLSTANVSPSSKAKYRNMAGDSVASGFMDESQHLPDANTKGSRAKQSSALSLLQFMSCGGLDIKEQILPMSLYRLRSRGTPGSAHPLVLSNYVLSPEHSSAESVITYGDSESSKSWTKVGKLKNSFSDGPLSSKPVPKLSGEFVDGEPEANFQGQCQHAHSMQNTSMSPLPVDGSMAKAVGMGMSDVISIARSSMSDRSTNASHELEFQSANTIARLKKSGEVPAVVNDGSKDPPRSATDAKPEISSDNQYDVASRPGIGTLPARALSGEILMNKGSPLFVPSKRHLSYSGTPWNSKAFLSQSINGSTPQSQTDQGNSAIMVRQDAHSKSTLCSSSSCNPSQAFSDGDVSCMLNARNGPSKSGDQTSGLTIKSYDQSMAQLWEELLAAPPSAIFEEHQPKDCDLRRVRPLAMGASSSSSWEVERTLQNAVELSLQPPLEHHLLNVDCSQCGRRMKPELMKAHAKVCISPKSPAASAAAATHYSCLNANLNSFGKSPKSNSNLCQRFLRASPTNL